MVLEVEDCIGGINQPEWGRDNLQIFGPGDGPYVLEATYDFSLNHDLVVVYEAGVGSSRAKIQPR